jgi:hypothetical protein
MTQSKYLKVIVTLLFTMYYTGGFRYSGMSLVIALKIIGYPGPITLYKGDKISLIMLATDNFLYPDKTSDNNVKGYASGTISWDYNKSEN